MYFKFMGILAAFSLATFVGAISSQNESLIPQGRESEPDPQTGLQQVGKSDQGTDSTAKPQENKAAPTIQKAKTAPAKKPESLKAESLLGAIHFGFSHENLKPDQRCNSCHQVSTGQESNYSPYFLEFFSNNTKGKGEDVAFLGVNASNVPPAIQSHLKLNEQQGTLVKNVVEESPAYHCGIEIHDVLLAIDQQPILGEKGLIDAIRSKKPGTKIEIEFVRRGKKDKCQLVLGKQKTAQMLKSFQIHGCQAELKASTKCQNCHVASTK